MERKQYIVSIDRMGELLGVEKVPAVIRENLPLFPLEFWSLEDLKKAEAMLDILNDPDGIYYVTQSPRPWLTLAFTKYLQPREVHYYYPAPPDVNENAIDVDLAHLLDKGTVPPEENCDVRFEIFEEGENIYVNMTSDTDLADVLGHHTFDQKNLYLPKVPDLPKDRHIFFHGRGMFSIMILTALSMMDGCRSFSMAGWADDYTCCYTTCEEKKIGDITKRTIPNNLSK